MNRSPPGNIPVNHHPLQVNESLTYTNETWDAARFSEMPRHASTYSHASKLIDRMSVPFPFGSVLNLCSVRSTCLFPLSRSNSELRFFYSLTFRSAFYLIQKTTIQIRWFSMTRALFRSSPISSFLIIILIAIYSRMPCLPYSFLLSDFQKYSGLFTALFYPARKNWMI